MVYLKFESRGYGNKTLSIEKGLDKKISSIISKNAIDGKFN